MATLFGASLRLANPLHEALAFHHSLYNDDIECNIQNFIAGDVGVCFCGDEVIIDAPADIVNIKESAVYVEGFKATEMSCEAEYINDLSIRMANRIGRKMLD